MKGKSKYRCQMCKKLVEVSKYSFHEKKCWKENGKTYDSHGRYNTKLDKGNLL